MFSAACVQGVSLYVAVVPCVAMLSYVAVKSHVAVVPYVLFLS